LLILFLWSHARSALAEKWGLTSPIWELIFLVLWAWLVNIAFSLVIIRGNFAVVRLHKRLRLIFLLPRYQPKLANDFAVDEEVEDKLNALKEILLNDIVLQDPACPEPAAYPLSGLGEVIDEQLCELLVEAW
jgi:hypothetical protein